MKHFLRVVRSNAWDISAAKISNVAVVFEQEAETWYNSRAIHWEDDERTWDEFEAAFLARFRAPGYLEQIQCAMHDPQQVEDESWPPMQSGAVACMLNGKHLIGLQCPSMLFGIIG